MSKAVSPVAEPFVSIRSMWQQNWQKLRIPFYLFGSSPLALAKINQKEFTSVRSSGK